MASYYETLGVAENATQDEIKQAYRKLALDWHPDRHKGDQAAEEKFKAINEANETLSDDSKRQAYDRSQRGFAGHSGNSGFSHEFTGFGGGPMEDILNQMFNHGFVHRGPAQNRNMTLSMNISLEDAYTGKQMPIQFNTPSGKRIDLVINIPAGVDSGTKIRYQGSGDHANPSLPPGDLFVIINIADHSIFKRDGSDIVVLSKVDALTAIVGGKIKTQCIDGSVVDVIVPSGTKSYSKVRVSGKGMPLHPGYKDYGDLILVIDIMIPSDLSKDQIDMLKDIQRQRGLDIT